MWKYVHRMKNVDIFLLDCMYEWQIRGGYHRKNISIQNVGLCNSLMWLDQDSIGSSNRSKSLPLSCPWAVCFGYISTQKSEYMPPGGRLDVRFVAGSENVCLKTKKAVWNTYWEAQKESSTHSCPISSNTTALAGKLERNNIRAIYRMKKCAAAVVLLGLLSLGQSAPLSSCDSLVKPITVSHDDVSALLCILSICLISTRFFASVKKNISGFLR